MVNAKIKIKSDPWYSGQTQQNENREKASKGKCVDNNTLTNNWEKKRDKQTYAVKSFHVDRPLKKKTIQRHFIRKETLPNLSIVVLRHVWTQPSRHDEKSDKTDKYDKCISSISAIDVWCLLYGTTHRNKCKTLMFEVHRHQPPSRGIPCKRKNPAPMGVYENSISSLPAPSSPWLITSHGEDPSRGAGGPLPKLRHTT